MCMSINLHLNLAWKHFNEATKSGIGAADDKRQWWRWWRLRRRCRRPRQTKSANAIHITCRLQLPLTTVRCTNNSYRMRVAVAGCRDMCDASAAASSNAMCNFAKQNNLIRFKHVIINRQSFAAKIKWSAICEFATDIRRQEGKCVRWWPRGGGQTKVNYTIDDDEMRRGVSGRLGWLDEMNSVVWHANCCDVHSLGI